MKIKPLLLLVLATSTTACFANPVSGGKLLSHQEWGVPNIKFIYKEQLPNKKSFLRAMNQTGNVKHDHLIQSMVKIQNITFNSNMINAKGYDVIYFMNSTAKTQLYNIIHSVCVVKDNDQEELISEQCSNLSDLVEIDPNAEYGKIGMYEMDWTKVEPGKYIVSFITSAQNTTNTVLFTTFDTQFITVPSNG